MKFFSFSFLSLLLVVASTLCVTVAADDKVNPLRQLLSKITDFFKSGVDKLKPAAKIEKEEVKEKIVDPVKETMEEVAEKVQENVEHVQESGHHHHQEGEVHETMEEAAGSEEL
jgi:gas vesicle protein